MTAGGWIAICVIVGFIIFSWFLVMGKDPRKWRGGDAPKEEKDYIERRWRP